MKFASPTPALALALSLWADCTISGQAKANAAFLAKTGCRYIPEAELKAALDGNNEQFALRAIEAAGGKI